MNQTLCAICCEKNQSLYNVQCPNCLECGYAHKLTCQECLKSIDKCPWCRSTLNHDLLQLKTWRTAPKMSRIVTRIPEKSKQLVSKFNNTKIFPKASNVIVKKKMSCFDICMWIKLLLSCFFMIVGICVTGYIIGVVLCGKNNCIFCIINGILGICYVLSSSMTISIALRDAQYKYKYTSMTIAHSSCTFFFTIMMFITFGTTGNCNIVIENGLITFFLIPCYICLTVKCVSSLSEN